MTTVGAIMQTLAISFIGIPVVGFVLYLAHVRHQTKHRARSQRRVTQIHRTTVGVSSTNLAEVVAPKPSTEHWIPL